TLVECILWANSLGQLGQQGVWWVNVPVCAAAPVAGAWLVPTSRGARPAPLDPPGALLSIVGLSALVYAIIEGTNRGWTSPIVLGAFGISLAVLAAFAA